MTDLPTATARPLPVRRAFDVRRAGVHLLVWVATLLVIAGAIRAGLRLRAWAWEITDAIHFRPDITRGYGWGLAASGDEGFLNAYDKMAAQDWRWRVFLDYAPLRLAVMTLWAGHNRTTQTPFGQWRPDYAFNAPVLWFNTGMELIGVAAAFMIVRRVTLDARRGPPHRSWPAEWLDRIRRRPTPLLPVPVPRAVHPPFTAWPAATVAALLLWFNPVMILSAHAWPTWDIWIVPMYLLAVLAAVYDAWLLAGVALAIGVMFKGQQLVGAPVFLAWTLLQGRWTAALRWGCGFVLGIAAVASPWLVTRLPADTLAGWYASIPNGPVAFDRPLLIATRQWNWPAVTWGAGVALVSMILPLVARRRERWMAAAWAAAVALLVWPLVLRHDTGAVAVLAFGATAMTAAALWVRRRTDRVILVLTSLAGALLACIHFFGASSAWWDCGIAYGTYHYPQMVVGFTDNLAGLLARRFGWQNIDEVLFTLPGSPGTAGRPVAVGTFLRGLFVLSLLPCLWAVARHARRRDPRLLIAVVAPWLMFFCFPAQIHERYLLYAAAIGSILIGQSVGMTLLGLVLTGLAFIQTIHVMLQAVDVRGRLAFGAALHQWRPDWFAADFGVTLHRVLWGTFPDAAWAVLLAAGIFLYTGACTTRRRPVTAEISADFGRQPDAAAVEVGRDVRLADPAELSPDGPSFTRGGRVPPVPSPGTPGEG